jgi:hypothetical protein
MEQVRMAGGAGGRETATSPPIGDFIAAVGGFAAFIFAAFLSWYSPIQGHEESLKSGLSSPAGITCFILGVCVFIFAVVIVIGGFINPTFRVIRSPGWVYGAAASIMFMACILGIVVTPRINGVSAGAGAGIIIELFAAAAIAVASMLKF